MNWIEYEEGTVSDPPAEDTLCHEYNEEYWDNDFKMLAEDC